MENQDLLAMLAKLYQKLALDSVTELEMSGLLVNMGLWKNILKHREFDAAVDHVAVTQILKAKSEPASNRIMRLLDRLSANSFNLYYLKGKDMILTLGKYPAPSSTDLVLAC